MLSALFFANGVVGELPSVASQFYLAELGFDIAQIAALDGLINSAWTWRAVAGSLNQRRVAFASCLVSFLACAAVSYCESAPLLIVLAMFVAESGVAMHLTALEAEALYVDHPQSACVRWLYTGRAVGSLLGGRLAMRYQEDVFDIEAALMLALSLGALWMSAAQKAPAQRRGAPREDVVRFAILLLLSSLAPSFSVTAYYYMTGRLGFDPSDMGEFDAVANVFVLVGTYWAFRGAVSACAAYALAQTVAALGFFALVHRENVARGVPDTALVAYYTAATAFVSSSVDATYAVHAARASQGQGAVFTFLVGVPKIGRFVSYVVGLVMTREMQIDHDDFDRLGDFAASCVLGSLFPLGIATSYAIYSRIESHLSHSSFSPLKTDPNQV